MAKSTEVKAEWASEDTVGVVTWVTPSKSFYLKQNAPNVGIYMTADLALSKVRCAVGVMTEITFRSAVKFKFTVWSHNTQITW